MALKKIDLKDRMLRVTRTQTRHKSDNGGYVYDIRDATKGRDRWREIALPEVAVTIINRLSEINPQEEFLFLNPVTGKRMMSSSFSEKLKRICEYPMSFKVNTWSEEAFLDTLIDAAEGFMKDHDSRSLSTLQTTMVNKNGATGCALQNC